MGGKNYLGQRLRASKRDSDNARDSSESLARRVEDAKGLVREVRDRKQNSRAKAFGGINKEMDNLGKELERSRHKSGTSRDSLVSANSKVNRLSSNLGKVRERSKRYKAYQNSDINGSKAAAERKRDRSEAEMIYNILEEVEV